MLLLLGGAESAGRLSPFALRQTSIATRRVFTLSPTENTRPPRSHAVVTDHTDEYSLQYHVPHY